MVGWESNGSPRRYDMEGGLKVAGILQRDALQVGHPAATSVTHNIMLKSRLAPGCPCILPWVTSTMVCNPILDCLRTSHFWKIWQNPWR